MMRKIAMLVIALVCIAGVMFVFIKLAPRLQRQSHPISLQDLREQYGHELFVADYVTRELEFKGTCFMGVSATAPAEYKGNYIFSSSGQFAVLADAFFQNPAWADSVRGAHFYPDAEVVIARQSPTGLDIVRVPDMHHALLCNLGTRCEDCESP